MKNDKNENKALSQTSVSRSVFKKLMKNTEKHYYNYLNEKGKLEAFFYEKVNFDFSIDYMPGDGFLLLHVGTASVCEVEKCFEIILKNGILTHDDVLSISI